MKTKLTLFVAVIAVALFGMGCASVKITKEQLQNGLVAYYPFSGNAMDGSGNGNHGEVKGASLGADRHGEKGQAYSFDGEDDYIDLTKTKVAAAGNSARSILLWVKTTQTSKHALFTSGSSGAHKRFNIYNDDASGILGVMGHRSDPVNYDFYPRTGINYNDGEWRAIGVTYNGDGVLMTYVDGALDHTATGKTYDTDGQDNYIGAKNHGGLERFLAGLTDDVRIYNRALSAEEVKALYDLEKPKGK